MGHLVLQKQTLSKAYKCSCFCTYSHPYPHVGVILKHAISISHMLTGPRKDD